MKVKDYKGENLKGLRVQIPKKFEDEYGNIKGKMYVQGVWNAGIWLSKEVDGDTTRIYPACIPPKELLNFTIVK